MNRASYEPYLTGRSWSKDDLTQIGFFDDGLSKAELESVLNDRRWVTPTSHLQTDGVVLCTTGAFSPFHLGHLRMLEIAKGELEARGIQVSGALVQPDHDAYVSVKCQGQAACPAAQRIFMAEEGTRGTPWIAVDPWAALYQDRALNYTTILERTRRLLAGRKVVYVFGSDNANFSRVFDDGDAVCVGRPGFAEPHPKAIAISSAMVRAEGRFLAFPTPTDDAPYLIRNDLQWATHGWDVSPAELDKFLSALKAAFSRFSTVAPVLLSVDEQQRALSSFSQSYVSFDPVTGSNTWVSRIFGACGPQHEPVAWHASDLSTIPPGDFVLLDDDEQSGGTVSFIKEHTPQVRWVDTAFLADWVHRGRRFDLMDARDFLFGARRAGLFIGDGVDIYRAPYISPWVNLARRAKIPPAAQASFVRNIIAANACFFEKAAMTVARTHNPAFWQRLGFQDDTPMLDICRQLLLWNPNS